MREVPAGTATAPAAPTKRQTYPSQKLRDEATAQRAKAKKEAAARKQAEILKDRDFVQGSGRVNGVHIGGGRPLGSSYQESWIRGVDNGQHYERD